MMSKIGRETEITTSNMPEPHNPRIPRRKRGFERTSGLLQSRIRMASETRGFSETRLLTHWAEVVGEETARMCEPVKVSYTKGGFGASLTVLTTGAFAPMLQAQLPKIKDRVNSVYGFNAISRIHITQTAPTGFAEGRASFRAAQKEAAVPVSEETKSEARSLSDDVTDDGLKKALETLATNFLHRQDKDRNNKS